MEIPFIGGAYKGRSTELNAQECVNLYPVIDQTGAKNLIALFGTPGLVEFCDSGVAGAEVRGLHVMGDYLYAVIQSTVYEIDAGGGITALSGTLSNASGPVWMAQNGTYLMIVEPGVEGYHVQQGGTVTAVSDADFPTPRALTFIDGYFVVSADATKNWFISGLNDPTSWDALDYETAERQPDNITAMVALKGQIALIGEDSVEFWGHTGAADWPFSYVALIDQGIRAPFSLARDESGVFFLSSRNEVVMSVGYELARISTDALDYHIGTYGTVDDAIGYIYSQEGHRFYVLAFPSANKTWVYDIGTQLWHERRCKDMSVLFTTAFGRHWSNCYAKFEDKRIVGGFNDGKIYYFDMSAYTDDGQEIFRRRAAQTVHRDQKLVFFHALDVDFEGGQGLVTGQGSDPQAMLDWSDDGGFTWSNEHWATVGAIGKYGARARWRKLGRSRNRVFRITVTDPIKVVIINAHAETSPGAH